jgi:hypothetical protein
MVPKISGRRPAGVDARQARASPARRADPRHNRPMPGFALFIGDHLARSVRGVPGAPPA